MSAEIIAFPAGTARAAVPHHGLDEAGLRPAAAAVFRKLCVNIRKYPGFHAKGSVASFDNAFLRTTLSFTPADVATPSGDRIRAIAEVVSDLPDRLQDISDQEMAIFNCVAVLGALLRDPGTGRLVVRSRVTLCERDEGRMDRYGMLLQAAVPGHRDQLDAALRLASKGKIPAKGRLPRRPKGEPSPWGPRDFDTVEAVLRQEGCPVARDAGRIEARVPWSGTPEGEVEEQIGWIEVSNQSPHPLLSDGLLCRLVLPLKQPAEDLVRLAHALNVLEAQALDAAPSFGAWCVPHGDPRLNWVAFMPDVIHRDDLALSMATWLLYRNWYAGEALNPMRP